MSGLRFPGEHEPAARAARCVGIAVLIASACSAQSSTSQPAGVPAAVQQTLESIEDFSFTFAQPGFYAVLRYVKDAPAMSADALHAIEARDWRVLLERPAEFRGRAITIEGRVGRNSSWWLLRDELKDIGEVWQLDLTGRNSPIACTVILTEPAGDLAIGSTIRVTGYFVMIRQYYDASNRKRQAALIVAQAPSEILSAAPRETGGRGGTAWTGWIVALTVGLLLAWMLLRRSTAIRTGAHATLRAEHAAPFSLADDLREWAERDDPTRDSADTNSNESGA